jgi:hypothetical protein
VLELLKEFEEHLKDAKPAQYVVLSPEARF